MYRDKFVISLIEEELTVFSIDDARTIAARDGVPARLLPGLLMRLAAAGWIRRLRRGLYVLSGPASGGSPVHPFAIAARLVTPSAISHWSALHYHGLTSQVPRIVTSMTPRKVVTPDMRRRGDGVAGQKHAWTIEGVRYEFTTVSARHYFGVEHVWVNERLRAAITDRERTLLELFIAPRAFGGIGEGLATLGEHLDALSVEKLVQYALQYGAVSVAKRLGWALENAGADSHAIKPLAILPASGYSLLDPSGARVGVRDRKWMIQNNAGVGPRG
jgi:predicted transcriptional regulator of viral defense system